MKIKKGTIVKVKEPKWGDYIGIARTDFDTEDEWYAIAVHQEKPVYGISKIWNNGDEIPCRNGLNAIEVMEV